MSNLISSFIIEPVVRHARRFSEAALSAASHGEPQTIPDSSSRLSRANGSRSSANKPAPRRTTSSPDTSHALDRDGSQSLTATVTSATATATATASSERSDLATVHLQTSEPTEPEDPPRSTAAAGHARLTQSLARTTAPPSRTASTILEDERSSNPAYGVPAPFRPAEAIDSSSLPLRGGASTTTPTRRETVRALTYPLAGISSAQVTMSESLPADDGMRLLRQRIHEIRKLGVSSDEKARRMHHLMTERYHAARGHVMRPRSPSSVLSQDRPFTPNSTLSDMHISSPNSSVYSTFDDDNPYNLSVEDLEPTFCPVLEHDGTTHADEHGHEHEHEHENELGCKHYKRNVKIQCFDCNSWHTCRHCHDEKEDHHLNRQKTRNMFCMICVTPQPAAEFCRSCHMRTAWYYCDICKLWDNDTAKSIYHCPDCGICRRGEGLGKDFIHCKVSQTLVESTSVVS